MNRHRLTLANSVALAVVSVVSMVGIIRVQALVTEREIDDYLRASSQSFALATPIDAAADPFGVYPLFVQMAGADGTILIRSASLADQQLPITADALQRASAGDQWFDTQSVNGHRLRIYVAPLHSSLQPGETRVVGVLQVASLSADELRPGVPLSWLVGIAVIAAAASFAIGWLLARMALAPVEDLASTVRTISSAEDLGQRVPLESFVPRSALFRLAQDVNGMLARVQSATRQLEAALTTQRQFVADASHELRTPLTSLTGNVQLLTRLVSEKAVLPAEEQTLLADMTGDTERMSRLVDELLLLAQADADQHLVLSPVELAPVLRGALRTARSLADGVNLQTGTLVEGIWVEADAYRLQQLVMILLDNALKYTPVGGTVGLSTRVLDRRADAAPRVAIDVADTGSGIDAADRERIFERFYRSASARGVADGAGLGLAVARWIAKEHDGEVTVRDADPRGAIFTIALPTRDPPPRN